MDEKEPEAESFKFRDRRRRYDEEESDDAAESEDKSQHEPGAGSGSEPLAEQEEAPAEETTGEDGGAAAPLINFSTFVLSLASSAAYHMGGFRDEVSGKTSINLDLAKQSIDMLAILEEKTKGNLTEEEAGLLTHSLYDLRMKFVEMSKK